MDNKKLEQLKQKYNNISIPEELDFIVRKSIKEGRKNMKRKNNIKTIKIATASVVASIILLTVGINTSSALAKNLSNIPVVGNIVKVLTFKEYKLNENNYNANIEVPEIKGLEDKQLEDSLNKKYLSESKQLYEQFIEEIETLEELGGGHLGIDNGYIVKTDTDKILSIGRYVVNTVASSSTTFKYDTIDKEKEILITLPSLFKDNTYIDIISENIINQMEQQMKSDENKIYWIEGYVEENIVDAFKRISKEQSFYINEDGKLVISFDKYEVAPGYMGTPEFVIPTETIAEVLVGDEYIK